MADAITWYALGRIIDDPETILEAIDTKILTHNQDPSAHGQSNEVVYQHRNPYSLDHPLSSVYARHVADDLSFIDQKMMSADVTVALLPSWTTLTELTHNLTSGKSGNVLMLLRSYVKSVGQGEDFYIRFKVTRNGNVSYYPSSDGLATSAVNYLSINQRANEVFSWVTDLVPGTITIEVQASTDSADTGNIVEGTLSTVATSFMIISVGSDITLP